ncbi:MAG: efflux RND transporter periplasmic adaptor subunit [Candidatus Omnitrophica bacterium]|nr:efflux RND transporter periplasmic adaptor subunit [Candidatus Omnitrophota bacterium]
MFKSMLLMLTVVGLIFGGIFGYQAFGNMMMKKYFASVSEPVVAVATIKARSEPWQSRIKAVGDLLSARGVEVSGEVSGQVQKVSFVSGDDVKENDILVELKSDIDQAQLKALEAAAELARINYIRDQKQVEIQAVSQAVVDADAAELKSREALVEQQLALISKKVIRAPFTGKLGISSIAVGKFLNPGEPIVTLQSLDPMRVNFYVPQQEIGRLMINQTIMVTSDARPGRTFEGKITAFNPRIEKDSRNVLVEAVLDNSKGELLPGMFAAVEVETGAPVNYVTIPQTCVSFNPYGETVYRIEEKPAAEDGKIVLIARQTFIKTGETRGDQIAVLEGVKAGEMVISAGQHKLKNGSVVAVNNEVQPSNDPAPKPQED